MLAFAAPFSMPTAVFLRYIGCMFEVLAFVYENYWNGDSCPELDHLERKLNSVGFDPDEIDDALIWLSGLSLAAHGMRLPEADPTLTTARPADAMASQATVVRSTGDLTGSVNSNAMAHSGVQSLGSMRVYSIAEQDHLGAQCLGFISFLETSGVLHPPMREIVLDRAMAAPGEPLALDDLKIIVLMVYWSFGEEPDALVLDELCDDASHRLAH